MQLNMNRACDVAGDHLHALDNVLLEESPFKTSGVVFVISQSINESSFNAMSLRDL